MLFGMHPLSHFTHPVPEKTAQQCFFNPKRICERTIGMRFSFKTNLGTILLLYL